MEIPKWMSWLLERHYDKAPIREAIIEIQIDQTVPLNLADLEILSDRVPGYSERRNLLRGQLTGQLSPGQQPTATIKQDQIGYQFIGGEGKHIAGFRLDGFAFSRLAPYQTWEQLRDEAKKLWALYRQLVGSASVTRVGLRYVNQLDLPIPLRDFRDYIRSYPEISSDLPQQLASFFMQVQIPQIDIGAMLILNTAIVPPPGPNVVSVVLDIDVIKDGLKSSSDEEAWNTMEMLRIRKNLIFEGCITNTTRELIS
jgi:uncharacterized protein (TIGR04255 family)